MISASILCSAIAARTAPQRRSSSAVEMGWLMRSEASAIAFPYLAVILSEAKDLLFRQPQQQILRLRLRMTLLPFYHIDHALQVPGEVLAHVFLDHGKREARVAVEEAALVLGDDDVLHVPEGRILGQGLLGEHVERGARDFPVLQCVEERVLVHHAAAREVDEEGGGPHRREYFRVDDVFRLGSEGRKEHEIVVVLHRLRELLAAEHCIEPFNLALRRGDAHHLHPQRLALRSELLRDRADAENSRGFSLEQLHRKAVPLALRLLAERARQLAREREH